MKESLDNQSILCSSLCYTDYLAGQTPETTEGVTMDKAVAGKRCLNPQER